jgi:hypothetical protein
MVTSISLRYLHDGTHITDQDRLSPSYQLQLSYCDVTTNFPEQSDRTLHFTIAHSVSKRSPHNRSPRAQRGSRDIALLILNLGARRGWVVSTTPRPFYPRERPGTHCT